MFSKFPGWVLGFHGCSVDTYNHILFDCQKLEPSVNTYDWLGNGIYFWENDYNRALEWAEKRFDNNAAVVGAIIDLGDCLNLSDSNYFPLLRLAYERLKSRLSSQCLGLPENKQAKGETLLRYLDCSVIQQVHDILKESGAISFDSVRGLFVEGKPIYEGSGLNDKTHI